MSNQTPRNPRDSKQKDSSSEQSSSAGNRNKALLVSISTAVLLAIFAVVTLFRTDFDTYPEDVDIKLVTRAPSSLSHEDKSRLVESEIECDSLDDCDDDEAVVDEEDVDVLIAAGDGRGYESTQQVENHEKQKEIQSLQLALTELQETLKEKSDVISYLQDELQAAKAWEKNSAPSLESSERLAEGQQDA